MHMKYIPSKEKVHCSSFLAVIPMFSLCGQLLISSAFPFSQETASPKHFRLKGICLHIHTQFKKYNTWTIFSAKCSCNYIFLLDMFYVIKACKYFISLKFSRTLLAENLFPFSFQSIEYNFLNRQSINLAAEGSPFPSIVFENNLISIQHKNILWLLLFCLFPCRGIPFLSLNFCFSFFLSHLKFLCKAKNYV